MIDTLIIMFLKTKSNLSVFTHKLIINNSFQMFRSNRSTKQEDSSLNSNNKVSSLSLYSLQSIENATNRESGIDISSSSMERIFSTSTHKHNNPSFLSANGYILRNATTQTSPIIQYVTDDPYDQLEVLSQYQGSDNEDFDEVDNHGPGNYIRSNSYPCQSTEVFKKKTSSNYHSSIESRLCKKNCLRHASFYDDCLSKKSMSAPILTKPTTINLNFPENLVSIKIEKSILIRC